MLKQVLRKLIKLKQVVELTLMDKKKGHRCDPIFVNLKSNTMKNTMQRYKVFCFYASFPK